MTAIHGLHSALHTPPDIYRQTAFELLRLAQISLHGDGKRYLLAASNACGEGKASTFHLSMFQFRAYCREMIALAHKIECEFDKAQGDEWEDCPLMYAP